MPELEQTQRQEPQEPGQYGRCILSTEAEGPTQITML